MLSDSKDKDDGLQADSADYSPSAVLSTSLSSITLPAKDQIYSALSSDTASVTGHVPPSVKDWSSSAPLENVVSSTNVPVFEPNKDKTEIFRAVYDSSSSSKSEATAPTASALPSNLDKDKASINSPLPTVNSVKSKDDGPVSITAISGTPKDQDQVSSSLVTFPFTSSTSHEKDKPASISVTINEKSYPNFVAPFSSAPENDQTSSTQQGSSPVSVPAQHTITIPAEDQTYNSLELTSTPSAPKQEQTVSSFPFRRQKVFSSPSLISSRQETSSRYVQDKDKSSASSQTISSASIEVEDKTSASSQVTSITSIPDKDKTPTYSSPNERILSSRTYASQSSSPDKDQIKSSYASSTTSKNLVTIPLSPTKDQLISSTILTKDQTTPSNISSNFKQTSSSVPVNDSSSGRFGIYEGKTISSPIPGSLVHASFVTLSSRSTDSRSKVTTTDSIPTKDQSLATSTATRSLPVKDQTAPTLAASNPGTNKYISVSVTSSPSILDQGARESIIRNILLSFGISASPKHEQPVTFKNDETSLLSVTVTPLSGTATTPAFFEASTGAGFVSVTSSDSDIPLITPKPETLIQTRIPFPGESLISTSRAPFLNTSTVIPVWTPAMLGNAYGGGYITTPSVFVTSFPNSPKSSSGIPPGYELSSKSENIHPPNYVPTPVIVKVEGSTTEFPSARTPPSASTKSKDETNKPSDSITPSIALEVEGSATAYPGAGTPTTLFTESNKYSGSVTPLVAAKLEGSISAFPGAGTPTRILTGSRDENIKPTDSLTPSVANEVVGSTTGFPIVSTLTALSTESKNGSNKPSDSASPPDSSLVANKPKDQTSGRVQTQAEISKSSNGEQKEATVKSGLSASISISRLYSFASPSAESKDDLDKSTGVKRISLTPSDDLPGKTLVPSQPSSVSDNDKDDKTKNLALVDIPNLSKAALSTTTVSKDKTDEVTTVSTPPSAGASIARVSISPLEPGYNDSIVSASRPTSVLDFEGLASKHTLRLSWGLICISAFMFLC